MCAGHDTLAENRKEVNLKPAVIGRKGNAKTARALPEMGCLKEACGRTRVRSEQRTRYMGVRRGASRRGRASPDIRPW